jgi:hypothetical protein
MSVDEALQTRSRCPGECGSLSQNAITCKANDAKFARSISMYSELLYTVTDEHARVFKAPLLPFFLSFFFGNMILYVYHQVCREHCDILCFLKR